uniref:CD81 molecule n=1 Tax=Taeniopygia guttata TaxID=59729 RepID=A0A674GYL1_TAEGU
MLRRHSGVSVSSGNVLHLPGDPVCLRSCSWNLGFCQQRPTKDVKQFYDQALQQALMGDADASNAKAVVKTFHETLDCCGSDIMTSTFTPLWRDDLCRKDSVKSFFENTNCHKKIDELFSGKLYLIGIAAVVVAVIMIFEMILSMVLCCGIRNSSVY